jgi:hypothetical protein
VSCTGPAPIDHRRQFSAMTGDGGQHGRLPGEDSHAVGGAHGEAQLHGLSPQLIGVGEAGLHRGDERLVPAHRPDHMRGADLVGDGVQPPEAAGGPGWVGQLDGDGVRRGVHAEFKGQITGGRRGGDRPPGDVGPQPRRLAVGAP